ncbi:MAG: hypothetical protein ACXIT4_09820 [Erythrobacter sp.]
MKWSLPVTALSALLSASLGAAPPPEAGSDDGDATDAEIIVRGDRPLERREISKGLFELTRRPGLQEVLPRFHTPLCVSVVGLGKSYDGQIAERIRRNAEAFGLDVDKGRCSPNAVVLIAGDPAEAFQTVRDKRPELLGAPLWREVTIRVLEHELEIKKPAVSWSHSMPVSHDDVSNFNPFGFAEIRVWAPNRATATHYRARQSAVVLFDYSQLNGVHIDQLADFATLHLLGSPQRSVSAEDAPVPTILTLFDEGPASAPKGLTRFDRAYLCGLYKMPRNYYATALNRDVFLAYENSCNAPQAKPVAAAASDKKRR